MRLSSTPLVQIPLKPISNKTINMCVKRFDTSELYECTNHMGARVLAMRTLLTCSMFFICVAAQTQQVATKASSVDTVRTNVAQITLVLSKQTNQALPGNLGECLAKSIVCIAGTGVFVDDRGDILTAAHVAVSIRDAIKALSAQDISSSIHVGMPLNREPHTLKVESSSYYLEASIDAIDPEHDVALLRTQVIEDPYRPGSYVQFRNWGDHGPKPVHFYTPRVQHAEEIFTCGFPLFSETLITTEGKIISNVSKIILRSAKDSGLSTTVDAYLSDVQIDHGNSGGPVFRYSDDALIGIMVEMTTKKPVISIIVPSKYLTELLMKQGIKWESASEKSK
jgi:S1-C subfamily serine protease